jgi:hypothetical protein
MQLISADFAVQLAKPMGCYYLFAAAANGAAAGLAVKRRPCWIGFVWLVFAAGFGLFGLSAFYGYPLQLPEGSKNAIDVVCTPAVLSFSFFASLLLFYFARAFFVKPAVAWFCFNAAVLWFGASLTDANFFAAVMRPDDVPIVAMVFLLGFFLWLAMHQAVENDRRMFHSSPLRKPTEGRSGEGPKVRAGPVEKEFSERVLVWPDLVYAELICMILLSAALIVWSLLLRAPLEQPANPAVTPNPSKAPWYFVGLQELLTFSDAWNAGLVVPALIVIGLMAIPYLDRSPAGSGYYSIRGRRFAILVFLFGFLQLWILPILIGTFLRGPNWSSFGLYEARDPSKLAIVEHLSLAQAFWIHLLRQPLPQAASDAGAFTRFVHFLYRDLPGATLLVFYFLVLPPLFGRTVMKRFRQSLGRTRYYSMMFLLLYMLTLPIKMILFWLFGVDSLLG